MAEPITTDEAKAFLRVDGNAEDGEIDSAIADAREWIEDYTGLVLAPRTVREAFDGFSPVFSLKSWPVTGITAVGYLGQAGAVQAIDQSAFRASVATRPARVSSIARWPRSLGASAFSAGSAPDAVTITLNAGYATSGDIPGPVKRALKLMIGHFYTNRSAVEAGARAVAVEIPFAVEALLRRYRHRSL